MSTVRVTRRTHERLAAIASSTGRPMTEVIERAVEVLERRIFFDRLDAGYERLRADESEWAEIEAERASEEGSLRDASR